MKIIVDKPSFPKHTAAIQYNAPRAVNIGDVFYRVHRAESKSFYPTCRVCEGKGELTINGITFKCPQCRVEAEAIHVDNYAVRRFRVFAIEDAVDTLEWKPSDFHTIKYFLYRKIGGGHWVSRDNTGATQFTADEFCREYNIPFAGDPKYHDGIYDDYKTALAIAAQMNETEINRLHAYNVEHGTAYAVDFTPKHDPK